MTNNTFFLRDDYTTNEKIDRIPSSKISPGVDIIDQVLSELEGNFSGQLRKRDFFYRIEEEFEPERYNEIVDEIFSEWGKKGDSFNLQLFAIPDSVSYEQVAKACEQLQGENLQDVFEVVSNEISLDRCIKDPSENTIAFSFIISEKIDDIEPTDEMPIRVKKQSGSEEYEYGPDWEVIAPSREFIESKLYSKNGILAVTNSGGVRDGVQSDIAKSITQMGRE